MRAPALSALFSTSLLAACLAASSAACTGDDPTFAPNPTDDGGTKVVPGTGCDAANPCAGGAACVDGFCCDTACTGTCEACNLPGKEGRCSPSTGKPRRACDGDTAGACAGSCDGKNGAACTYPTTACGTASCAGGTATLPSTCKAGTCQVAETQKCALGCLEDGCLGVKQVAAGYYHTCAVLTDQKVRCWGGNDSGQTGVDASTLVVPKPVEVQGITSAVQVATTFGSTCILLADKTVKCMGNNAAGQLGLGVVDNVKHSTPTLVVGLTDVTFLGGSSGGHYCAITTSGAIKCWGGNAAGQLGDGSTTANKPTPVTVCQPGVVPCAPSSGATFVAGGDNHTCATFAGGKVGCWGGNSVGQLGQPAGGANPLPKLIVPDLTATYLTAGNQVTCAASGGGAKCWGSNGLGILGGGTVNAGGPTPVSVCTKADCSALLTGVTAVTTYDESACALASGAVKCWGTNTGGQLGDGNASASQSYAATSAVASGAVYVGSGGQVNLAIIVDRANRDLRCWGNEGQSQCGTGTPDAVRKTPVAPAW